MLKDKAVRAAVAQGKAYKRANARGLHHHLSTSGHKSWRYKYRFENKELLLIIGTYPEVFLADARERRVSADRYDASG